MATLGRVPLEPLQFITLPLSLYFHRFPLLWLSPPVSFYLCTIGMSLPKLHSRCLPHVWFRLQIFLWPWGEQVLQKFSLKPGSQTGKELQIHHSPPTRTLDPVRDTKSSVVSSWWFVFLGKWRVMSLFPCDRFWETEPGCLSAPFFPVLHTAAEMLPALDLLTT